MNAHQNARTNPYSRALLVARIEGGWTGGDCQEFRVQAMTMGRKEPSHGTPQSTDYP